MTKYVTHKRSAEGMAQTLARKVARRNKYMTSALAVTL